MPPEQRAALGISEAIESLAEDSASASRLTGNQPIWALVAILAVSGVILLFTAGFRARRDKDVSFQRIVEGLILVDVLGAVLLLGLSEKIGDQDLVSILAAITGYAITRLASNVIGSSGGGGADSSAVAEAVVTRLRSVGAV